MTLHGKASFGFIGEIRILQVAAGAFGLKTLWLAGRTRVDVHRLTYILQCL
jgi:hypothetical protein